MNARKRAHAGDMIARFKEFYGFRFDTDMARKLGLSDGSAIGNWRRRDTIDLLLIADRCPEINLDWLIWGRGGRTPSMHEDGSGELSEMIHRQDVILLVSEALENYLKAESPRPDNK